MGTKIYPVYLRIAKTSTYNYRVDCGKSKKAKSICDPYYPKKSYPTLQFKINLEIKDEDFDRVQELNLKVDNPEMIIDIEQDKTPPQNPIIPVEENSQTKQTPDYSTNKKGV